MSEQSTWVPLPKKRTKAAKLPEAIAGADKMIDWYLQNKPGVRRVAVTPGGYKAFEEAVGTHGIVLSADGIKYRGFMIYATP